MAQYIEDFLPPIQSEGLNTQENVSFSGTNTFSGATTVSGTFTLSGSTISITGASTSSTKGFVALNATSTGATTGGVTTPALAIGTASGNGLVGIYAGAGAPTIAAGKSSLYLNVAASNGSTRLYINTDGGTTWSAIQTL